jgi:hypothetical protein
MDLYPVTKRTFGRVSLLGRQEEIHWKRSPETFGGSVNDSVTQNAAESAGDRVQGFGQVRGFKDN